MAKRSLLPWPNRIGLVLRARAVPFAVVGAVALAFLALDLATGADVGSSAWYVAIPGVSLALAGGGLWIGSRAAVLWAQKPGPPVRHYLSRSAENLAAAVGAAVLLAVIFGGLAQWLEWDTPTGVARNARQAALVSLTIASVATGASVWLPRTGWVAALAVLGASILLQFLLLIDPMLGDARWTLWADALLMPWESWMALREIEGLGAGTAALALLRTLGYSAAWIGLGALGVHVRLASGGLTRA